jgi:hypothetical protein
MNICAVIHQNIENGPDILGNVMTFDESLFLSMTRKQSANPCIG